MPNINISGVQGAYKTSSMVYQMKRLIALYPEIYTADSIHTNLNSGMIFSQASIITTMRTSGII